MAGARQQLLGSQQLVQPLDQRLDPRNHILVADSTGADEAGHTYQKMFLSIENSRVDSSAGASLQDPRRRFRRLHPGRAP